MNNQFFKFQVQNKNKTKTIQNKITIQNDLIII